MREDFLKLEECAHGSADDPEHRLGKRAHEADTLRVAELWLPSHCDTDCEVANQFIASLSTPISLEIFGSGHGRSMLVRASDRTLSAIASRVCSLWPRARLQILQEDPVGAGPDTGDKELNASILYAEPPYLPLRIWDSFRLGDPIHGLLSAMLGLREDERLWLQILILEKGEPDWLGRIKRRLKTESQRGFIASDNGSNTSGASIVSRAPVMEEFNPAGGFTFLGAILIALILAVLAVQGSWLPVVIGAPLLIAGGGFAWRLLDRGDDPWQGADLSLVRQKVVEQDTFFKVAIRAGAWAASLGRRSELLQRLEAHLGQFAVSGGNRLNLRNHDPGGNGGQSGIPDSEGSSWIWLGSKELAGFWHPPVVNEQVSPGSIPIRSVEVRAPDPRDVRGIYRIGSSFRPDGGTEPVHISQAALRRNILLVGKPGTGKTNLMTHMALAGLQDPDRPAVVVVDPHGDMAERLGGMIDPTDKERVVIMDVGDEEFALTYNPLDPHRSGWDVESVTNSIVDIGQALWTDYWGPRMQNVLKRGVQLLVAVNAERMPEDLLGLSILAAVLNVNHETRKRFIENELQDSPHHAQLSRWFYQYYKSLSPYTRETIIQSVMYKAHRFEEKPLLHLFSAPRSALDLRDILEGRKLLIVNTRMSRQGPELSSFVGSLITNMLLREIARQGDAQEADRIPVLLVIDEFQTFTGVPWQELLAQMRKYGGRVVIGTQSLASLRQDGNGKLPGIITSGVHSLFAFLMNGEDADYLTKYEFGRDRGGPGAETLTNLEPYRAYARIVREDGTMAAPFYFETAPPPEFDAGLAEEVRILRARYSVPYETAEREAREQLTYLERYAGTHMSDGAGSMRARSVGSPLNGSGARSAMLEADEPPTRVASDVRKMIASPWGPDQHREVLGNKEEESREDTPDGGESLVENRVEVDFEGLEDMIATDQDEDLGVDEYPEGGDGR